MRVHLFADDLVDSFISSTARVYNDPQQESFNQVEEKCAHEGQPQDHHDKNKAQDDKGHKEVLIEEAKWHAIVCDGAY